MVSISACRAGRTGPHSWQRSWARILQVSFAHPLCELLVGLVLFFCDGMRGLLHVVVKYVCDMHDIFLAHAPPVENNLCHHKQSRTGSPQAWAGCKRRGSFGALCSALLFVAAFQATESLWLYSCIRSTCGLVAMTSASHAEGCQLDPSQVYSCCSAVSLLVHSQSVSHAVRGSADQKDSRVSRAQLWLHPMVFFSQVRCSIVVSISACHAEDLGPTPGAELSHQ